MAPVHAGLHLDLQPSEEGPQQALQGPARKVPQRPSSSYDRDVRPVPGWSTIHVPVGGIAVQTHVAPAPRDPRPPGGGGGACVRREPGSPAGPLSLPNLCRHFISYMCLIFTDVNYFDKYFIYFH